MVILVFHKTCSLLSVRLCQIIFLSVMKSALFSTCPPSFFLIFNFFGLFGDSHSTSSEMLSCRTALHSFWLVGVSGSSYISWQLCCFCSMAVQILHLYFNWTVWSFVVEMFEFLMHLWHMKSLQIFSPIQLIVSYNNLNNLGA